MDARWVGYAYFSNNKTYRLKLSRRRLPLLKGQDVGVGRCIFIMLNPSKAGAIKNDNTVRRCMSFTIAFGYNKLVVLNLFTGVATNPEDLWKMKDPIGSKANVMIEKTFRLLTDKDIVICAWGSEPSNRKHAKLWRSRVKYINRCASKYGIRLYVLGFTKEGHPRHPLYLKKDARVQQYNQ